MSKPILRLNKPLPSPLLTLLGQQVIVQVKATRYQGLLRCVDADWLVLDDAVVNGTKTRASVKRLLIKTCSHLHAAGAVVSLEVQPCASA